MIKIILAEDHNIVRNGIKVLLESEEGLSVVGEAKNGQEVLNMISKENHIDLVLADINMPVMDGIELVKKLKATYPKVRLIILSMLDSEKYVIQAFSEGACGYLLKNVSSDELIFAIKHVSIGSKYLCSELSIKMLERLINSSISSQSAFEDDIDFSSREIEVLNLIAQGLTNHEMSEKLFLSKRTIEGHRQSLIEKTGSRNTASLIRYAVLNGIVQ
ncbi:response regulator transcription factor [Albibacterium bauzanense]|uniref:LuxR family two component transcriptional regulator n=1 Tax=Albibacterium bauzanense TaxID=653929 RepID=A0A4R1LYE4_9SPHI|nr:response regulator transcription factor [Albibacterium bauzanense]TCK83584.1 LuxR family two component transcriptional regulator [Albibacterium bauzanense]